MKEETACKHLGLIKYERIKVEPTKTANGGCQDEGYALVIRCKECGTVMGALPADILTTIISFGTAIRGLYDEINETKHLLQELLDKKAL